MISSKRGFTLIELLVVIAIIAILAAILFPVFAQAKQAAKATASISNDKQTVLAALIYTGDYDDHAVLSQAWNATEQNDSDRKVDAGWVTIWTYLIQPYIKSKEVQDDPAGPHWRIRTERNWTASQSHSMMPGFGYNSTTFSYYNTADWPADPHYITLPMTSVARPAQTIMFAASMVQYVDSTFGFYWVLGGVNAGWVSWGNIDSPACGQLFDHWCGGGWGDNFNWGGLIQGTGSDTNGYRSGAVSMRVARQGVFGFSDGHVKRMPLSRAAAGTNWTPDISNWSVVITDQSKYMWNEQ